MSNTKGQGVSINVIIIAAIALVVLIVVIAIFTTNIGKTTVGIEEITEKDYASLFRADCHPDFSITNSYKTQKAEINAEIAALEAQETSTVTAEGRISQLNSNFAQLEAACGEIKTQTSCNVPVSRDTLSGNCEWK